MSIQIDTYGTLDDGRRARRIRLRAGDVEAVLTDPIRAKDERRHYVRVRATERDGEIHAYLTGGQGSGILSSMSAANCFIVLPEEAGPVSAGDAVTVQPFAAFV